MSGGKWWSSGLERQDMDAEIHGETVRTPVPQCDVRKGIQSSTPCAGTPKQWRYINMDEKQPRRTTWAVRTEWTEKKRTGSLRISWKWWPKPPEMTSAADRPPSFNHSVSHIFLLPSFPFPASCPFNRSRIPFHFPSPILFLNPSPFSFLSLVHSVQHFPKKLPSIFPTVRLTFILWFLFSFVFSPRTFQYFFLLLSYIFCHIVSFFYLSCLSFLHICRFLPFCFICISFFDLVLIFPFLPFSWHTFDIINRSSYFSLYTVPPHFCSSPFLPSFFLLVSSVNNLRVNKRSQPMGNAIMGTNTKKGKTLFNFQW